MTGRLVMIVDDDHDIRESVADILHEFGYRSMTASNGRDAMDRLRSMPHKPCVILLDLMMPVMDGQEFRDEQIKDLELVSIPVVVLSAHTHAQEVAQKMDVELALKKPIDLEQLMITIRRLCPEMPAPLA